VPQVDVHNQTTLKYSPPPRYRPLRRTVVFLNNQTNQMARFAHYSPPIRRELVRVLYHERKSRGIPMTRLVEEILTEALKESPHWRMMEDPPEIKTTPGQRYL